MEIFNDLYQQFDLKGKEILDFFSNNMTIEKEHIKYILSLNGKERYLMYEVAKRVKNFFTVDYVSIKALIEFSNYCSKNCDYCGIRRDNLNINRYRMSNEEIINSALKAKKWGLDTIVLQSGEDNFFKDEDLMSIIKIIREKTKLPVSISIGERSLESYLKFKKSGAIRTLIKHESINKELFDDIHPDKNYYNRVNILKYTDSIGYVTGSGFIVGLPNQTDDDMADDIIFMRDENVRMIGIGPLIASKNTPFENMKNGSVVKTMNACCAARLTVPKAQMPATTALGTLNYNSHYESLKYFCNVVMVNITPDMYRKNYNIYDNKAKIDFFETLKELKKRNLKVSPITMKALSR
ncbi:[FeFe] hydrogenase H-cluster radical SAM maturase HydE [Oceanotoga sp. DSM 15011]|uniref:[FeFe] hydrogenase H-cluster radical SAM maturase HydE n=1 Tax=Oceanotoga sp. DSM 15011 TaxID=2984951 RepID=UPI0021F4D339|nr:[FeFe] hydrogenase H-cluster radical SAM maturase HydE [Oceanotoga sp. DSM 15011]UYO99628.1 [FeFe] hydrogenase H-cluster radical SAM maturase HydE [Oceanotoga sp. DSM 15011]